MENLGQQSGNPSQLTTVLLIVGVLLVAVALVAFARQRRGKQDIIPKPLADDVATEISIPAAQPAPKAPPPVRREESITAVEAHEVAELLAYVRRLVIVSGYGMAAAQAQHKLYELSKWLEEQHQVEVSYVIHPVAGRLMGHLDMLLAEAGVSYTQIRDIEAVNADLPDIDLALVVGANDIVNTAASNTKNSPLYGLTSLDVAAANTVVVIKRGQGMGYAGVDNPLFLKHNTVMLYGDAKKVITELIAQIKQL